MTENENIVQNVVSGGRFTKRFLGNPISALFAAQIYLIEYVIGPWTSKPMVSPALGVAMGTITEITVDSAELIRDVFSAVLAR
ncbi:hypothetical protein [Haloterrigena salinisoli]|uniref:hypothetical protein n=1 Tax=Haloterrigena salinisoli TaxID=3132747 RepID=UPI0030CEB614